MDKYIFFNPALSSINKGDEIIAQSCKRYLEPYIKKGDYCIDISTHLPVVNYYFKVIGEPKISFVLGSNLLGGKMCRRVKQWFITPQNIRFLKNIVLMGAGWRTYNEEPDIYTKTLYKAILKNDFIHSVRDEYTKDMLQKIGINNVINTGCPTMWGLTREFCAQIPTEKADSVIFTLTDYRKDIERDRKIVECLVSEYRNVSFWIQGIGDYAYLKRVLEGTDYNIGIVGSGLENYQDFLISNNCDYVGTRLHAGIKAMQLNRRTLIIGIDNRAIEMQKDFNINCIHSDDLEELSQIINSKIVTDIKLNEAGINCWKDQFVK